LQRALEAEYFEPPMAFVQVDKPALTIPAWRSGLEEKRTQSCKRLRCQGHQTSHARGRKQRRFL